jgi:hypothetical protein
MKIKIYRTIILSVVLYGRERLKMFKNRVLRKLLGPRMDKETGERRRLQNEELNDLHSSPNIIQVIKSRGMKRVRQVACMGGRIGSCRVLVGRPE